MHACPHHGSWATLLMAKSCKIKGASSRRSKMGIYQLRETTLTENIILSGLLEVYWANNPICKKTMVTKSEERTDDWGFHGQRYDLYWTIPGFMAVVYRCVGILTVNVVISHSQDSFPSTFRPQLWDTSSGVVAVGVFAAEARIQSTPVYNGDDASYDLPWVEPYLLP